MKQSVPQPRSSRHFRQSGQASSGTAPLPDALRELHALARVGIGARFSPIEWVLLATIVVVPVGFWWHFASPSYFQWDDFAYFYWAHTDRGSGVLSYAFASAFGHLSPANSLTYLALERVAPMNFEVALAFLLACQTASAVLLQRILTLVFGRAWWTYAVAFAWAISIVHLPTFACFAAGLHPIPAITATLASIHAYLCWRATARRAWLVWSLVAMVIGLGFYIKALLIPLYLVLMRVLLLDPEARLRDSLRSLRAEWRVWLAYAAVAVVYLVVYSLGDYARPASGASVGEVLDYLRIFWLEGLSPMLFGIRVPQYGQEWWHQLAIVAAQVALLGLVAWSVSRRRTAWRAWAFLFVAVLANALMVEGGSRSTARGPLPNIALLPRARAARGAGDPVRVRDAAAAGASRGGQAGRPHGGAGVVVASSPARPSRPASGSPPRVSAPQRFWRSVCT